MPVYEVYPTRFDSTGIVAGALPVQDLSFSLPLSDHGECSFSATVEPGGGLWRPAMALPFSGVLVTRDGVPVWSGPVIDERPSGPRSFQFTCREWGWWFEEMLPAVPNSWTQENDHVIFRDLVTDAQAVSGQDVKVEVGSTLGASVSDWTVNPWDTTTAGREFVSLGRAEGGPEWYFQAAGSLEAPRRVLILGDRLGHVVPERTLEYVDGGSGGNVVAQSRSRSLQEAATVVVATGSGDKEAQKRATASAGNLLNAGWPRITRFSDYVDVERAATLWAHARADLAAHAGIPSSYTLTTRDGDPSADWTQTPRGSSVRVVLDTDMYGADRPVGGADGFVARTLGVKVSVPTSGAAEVEWSVADVLEVF